MGPGRRAALSSSVSTGKKGGLRYFWRNWQALPRTQGRDASNARVAIARASLQNNADAAA